MGALDAYGESKLIKNFIDMNDKSSTVFFVTHKLSSVKHADRILMMDNGKILEDGTHHELITCKGAYYELFMNQAELYIDAL